MLLLEKIATLSLEQVETCNDQSAHIVQFLKNWFKTRKFDF